MAENKSSNANNEMYDRLFILGGVAIVAILFLMVAPIVIGGFVIGLVWYGAYMEDGEPNGNRLAWPIAITLLTFIYLFGTPVTQISQGVLFTDFGEWTSRQVWDAVGVFNHMLPKKMEIRNIPVEVVRYYAWGLIPAAAGTLGYLHWKGRGGGRFLYQGFWFCLAPARLLSVQIWWALGFATVTMAGAWLFSAPYWLRSGIALFNLPLIVYSALLYMRTEKALAKIDASPAAAGDRVCDLPITVGSEKGQPNKQVKVTQDALNHHIHIVGASGFGKSVLLSHIVKNRIESGSGLLFVDLKADFETIRQVVSVAKGAGRLKDLAIFSCGNPEFSSHYNVVASGTANQLKDRIMGALNWSEEYYKNEAQSFLLKTLKGLVWLKEMKGRPFDLGTILRCADDPMELSKLSADVPDSQRELKDQLEGLAAWLDKAENRKALQGLRSQLESLLLSDFGHLLKASGSGIDLFEAVRGRKIVYILLDSRTYGESSRALGKLILQDLKAASARIDNEIPRDKRTPFAVVVDEFSDLATEDFIGFLDRARSSKIGVVVAHQEIADLSRISPEFTRRLMNSTSTLFAFLQKLPDSSELIAGITGTKKSKEVTEQAKSTWLFGDEKTGMKTIRDVDEYVIHPNVIRSLSVGECVCVQKYPSSKAAQVKVRAEVKNYLSDGEVRLALNEIAGQNQFKRQDNLRAAAADSWRERRVDRDKDADKF